MNKVRENEEKRDLIKWRINEEGGCLHAKDG